MPQKTLEIPVDVLPLRSAFVELGLVSCFSFLRGASDAADLVQAAHAHGYDAIGLADANSLAGVVRLHTEAKALKLRPVIGCRIETVEGLAFLAYPEDRAAYGRLCRLISAGRMHLLSAPLARADEANRLMFEHGPSCHPRDHRILPKSRDFH